MTMTGEPITEYRRDGWPICPCCGENEVMSWLSVDYIMRYHDQHGTNPPLADFLDAWLSCLVCGWERPERFVLRIAQDEGR